MSTFDKLLDMPTAAILGYEIGCALAERDKWMLVARDTSASQLATRSFAARTARARNHGVVRKLAELRAWNARQRS